jgi:hypothetical protein
MLITMMSLEQHYIIVMMTTPAWRSLDKRYQVLKKWAVAPLPFHWHGSCSIGRVVNDCLNHPRNSRHPNQADVNSGNSPAVIATNDIFKKTHPR